MEKPPPPRFFFFFNKRSEIVSCIFSVILLLSFLIVLRWFTPFQPLLLLRIAGRTYDKPPPDADAACDYTSGQWVWDGIHRAEAYAEDCPFLDPGFRCRQNGRSDSGYLYWRWQPRGCNLPKFNASKLLERSRNGKIVFVGDSIGRNQWESLVCMLAKAVHNQSSIYEKYGNPITKHRGFLSIVFHEHNLTVEYYRAPFLAAVSRPPPSAPSGVRSAIHLDELNWQSKHWVDADVLVLNAGHWWNQKKTIGSGMHFQVGGEINMTMDVKEAFRRTIDTVKLWSLNKLQKGSIFFRNHSPIHFSNGTWDEGGTCSAFTEPERSYSALRPADPWNNWIIADAVEGMKSGGKKARLLNITGLTEFRRDGHPSKHREPGTPPDAPQDCSHWCLPGVPDTWNQLLYAHLLSMDYDTSKNV